MKERASYSLVLAKNICLSSPAQEFKLLILQTALFFWNILSAVGERRLSNWVRDEVQL
jgi:hypothetical protein